jgi:hypothetical protein
VRASGCRHTKRQLFVGRHASQPTCHLIDMRRWAGAWQAASGRTIQQDGRVQNRQASTKSPAMRWGNRNPRAARKAPTRRSLAKDAPPVQDAEPVYFPDAE